MSPLLIVLAVIALVATGCIEPPVEQPRTPTPDAEELEARRDRIRKYFEEQLERREIVATTMTESGQIIDWIWPESQTSDGFIAKPPEEVPHREEPEPGTEPPTELSEPPEEEDRPAQTELQLQPQARGPEGTVPVVRFDVEAYLESVDIPPEDPRDVLQKVPPPAPASNDRYYVAWQRFADTFYGSAGRINIWDTSGPVGNETSIAQVAVIRGSPMQAIEAGKIELQSLNGNREPHLFVYYRTSGSASGDWVGGYNKLVDGWVQYSSSVAPGLSLVPWESRENGAQYSLPIEVRLHEGNWWVRAAGEWAGYYPYCKGGDATPCNTATLFSASGLRDKASRLDWYGEVYDSSAPAATSTDMGSGDFAADWWQHAAYMRNILYFWAPATAWWFDSGSLLVTDSACYSGSGPHYSSDPSWRNWFFYGGPGKEASSCR